jgi:hypothetical protein
MHLNGQEVKDRAMSDQEKNSKTISNETQRGTGNERNEANENNGVTYITEWTVEIDPNGKRYPITRRRIVVDENGKVKKPEQP